MLPMHVYKGNVSKVIQVTFLLKRRCYEIYMRNGCEKYFIHSMSKTCQISVWEVFRKKKYDNMLS
jgi:hypothetical protein